MSDITFKYKGVTKGTMDASGTATLNTAGLYSEADYVIEYQKPSIVVESDSEPYSFRANTVNADSYTINKIIGGTVAWNQLVPNANATFTSGNTDTRALNFYFRQDVSPYTSLYNKSNVQTGILSSIVSASFDGYIQMVHAGAVRNMYYVPRTTISVRNGHKYLFSLNITGTDVSVVGGVTAKDIQIIDLTAMFGTTIADYVYTLESGTAGAGVAWLKKYGWFTKPYYPYKAAALESVKTSAHKMTGFNQWDEEWEVGGINSSTGANVVGTNTIRAKNNIRIIPNTVYHYKCSAAAAVRYYDASGNYLASYAAAITANSNFTTPSDAAFMRFVVFATYGTTYNHDICINLSLDGERNGEYEPYVECEYALGGTIELRGILKLDANNNLYYDGDEYASDGTVTRRYGVVDLGTLNWQKTSGKNHLFNTSVSLSTAAYGGSTTSVCHAICSNYVADKIQNTYSNEVDKTVSFTATGYCYIEDSAYSDAATFKTAMSGVYLVYKLATQTTETATPYTNIGRIGKCYTESFIDYRTPSMPVGHNTEYLFLNKQVNTVGYSYLGINPVKIADYATQTVALSNTDFATWTPSTTYTTIYASSDVGTVVLDLANYNYNIVWFFDIEYKYDGTESSASKALRACQCMQQSIFKNPNELTALSAQNFNGNYCTTLFTAGLIDYYNASSAQKLAYTLSVAAYLNARAATFSNSTTNTPTLTVKTPSVRFVCNNTYLSTANCAKIDKANTKFTLRGELWRVDKDSVMQGMYKNIIDAYNS